MNLNPSQKVHDREQKNVQSAVALRDLSLTVAFSEQLRHRLRVAMREQALSWRALGWFGRIH